MKTENNTLEFNWAACEAEARSMKRVPNPDLFKKYGVKVWRHGPTAEEQYLAYEGKEITGSKEAIVGECRNITSIVSISNTELIVTLSGMIEAVIQLDKEKTFFKSIGMTKLDFIDLIKNADGGANSFIGMEDRKVIVENVKPFTIASLSKGYLQTIRTEFFNQIKEKKSAYTAKIIARNGGGFLVNVGGIEGFMPGSLAAANIVRDFESMIGKEVFVMVEDYLKDAGTFVFSHKKYLSHVIPTKIAALSLEDKYTGTVTGSAKFGIFVEFNEIFTGLIHTSKMSAEMRESFKDNGHVIGSSISFWIKEITPDKKIILTDEDPSIRMRELADFKEKNLGVITGGEVISIQPFGALIKIQKDIVGLISQKEIKTKKKNYAIGQHVMVNIERVHNDKIFLTIPNED